MKYKITKTVGEVSTALETDDCEFAKNFLVGAFNVEVGNRGSILPRKTPYTQPEEFRNDKPAAHD